MWVWVWVISTQRKAGCVFGQKLTAIVIVIDARGNPKSKKNGGEEKGKIIWLRSASLRRNDVYNRGTANRRLHFWHDLVVTIMDCYKKSIHSTTTTQERNSALFYVLLPHACTHTVTVSAGLQDLTALANSAETQRDSRSRSRSPVSRNCANQNKETKRASTDSQHYSCW